MLIAIDLQNDYWDPKGKFYVKASGDIFENVKDRIRQAVQDGELLIYTRNVYKDDDEDEERSEEELQWAQEIYPPFEALLSEGIELVKDHYGIAPEEALELKKKYEHVEGAFERIEFVGVETNVCVMANVNIIQNIFKRSKIYVHGDRTCSSDLALYEAALDVMEGLKIHVKRT